MSRQIDVDNLSEDDVLYLRDRPNLIAEAKLQGVSDIEERMAEVTDPKETPDEPGDTFNSEAQGYDSLNLTELRETAKARGLDTKGRKADLQARLEEDDAKAAATSEEAEGAKQADEDPDDESGDDSGDEK